MVHIAFGISINSFSQTSSDTIVLRDLPCDSASPARIIELNIPSNKSLLEGFAYKKRQLYEQNFKERAKIADTIFVLNTKSGMTYGKH